jgi:cytochrome P450
MLGALASSPDVDGAVATAAFSFLAGFTNTANLLALTLLALARHPEQYSRLRETPEAVRRALDELLRYAEPDGRVSLRVARHDVDIAGRRCPAGTTVQISRALAARDPEVFRDPDTLDIDRPAPIAHLAFGHGRHRCPAPRLVRLTVGIVLHALRVRVTAMSPAGGDVAWDVAARRPLLLRISTAQQASTAKRPPQEGQRT